MKKLNIGLVSFLVNSINIRSLSSYLKANGYNVTCFFCKDPLDDVNLAPFLNVLKEQNISLVGISFVTDHYGSALKWTKEIKEKLKIPVIWGGAHVNVKPEECLEHADMICMGEAEESFLDLVENYSEGAFEVSTKNIWFKTEKGIVRNELRNLEENLDKYPFPDFDLTSQFVLTDKGVEHFSEEYLGGEYSVMTSRGCPYSCNYCYNSYRRKQYSKKGEFLRARSIENVIEELVLAKKTFPSLRKINFWDDSFVARSVEDFTLFKRLYREKVNLPFFALIEPMAFNFEKIKILRDSGLVALQVGIQTGSERINRDVYNRRASNRKILEVAGQIRELGINVIYDVIFNNPYETESDVSQTVKLFLEFPRPVSLQGYNLIFYPGTEITDRALADGHISFKHGADDFSTIEGAKDTPTLMRGKSVISERFYQAHYTSEGKEYWNTVLSLFACRHVPWRLIRYFGQSKSPLKGFLLRLFVRLYALAHLLKGMVKNHE